jgi:uroporphyrinogen-III synthase
MGMARQSTRTAIPVLLTRPEAASRAFAAALVARFGDRVRPVICPLMAPVTLTPTLPEGPFAAVIFTSATGVAAAKGLDLPRRAFCVGGQTAAQARAVGFDAVSADGDADALVAAILADPPPGRLLHLRGEETRGEVAERLTADGLETVSVVVYRQEAQALTDEALDIMAREGAVIVPLFSPRTAALFDAAAQSGVRARLRLVAMSAVVAEAARGIPHEALEVARRPDADAMLEAVGRLLDLRPVP